MPPVADLLREYGVALLFVWAFGVQAGLPAPAIPVLLAAGALSGSGLRLAVAIGAAVAATLGADILWYWLGRTRGARVLAILCRISLRADSLVRSAKERFAAHGARYLILAKFLPGVNPLASGIAGAFRTRPKQFILYAGTGALAWAGTWITLGYLCADLIGAILAAASRMGTPLIIAIAVALVLLAGVKYARRLLFMRHLLLARIDPLDLKQRLDRGERVLIVDLRTALDIQASPLGISGARWIPPERLDGKRQPIPNGNLVVFYCAEPREATSARIAGLLSHHGYKNVRPLSGGLEAWRRAGFSVEPIRSELGGREAPLVERAPSPGSST
jgi:membrane protein DedA with SNARE-associated domain/rhodanese-related sulfurtransferase